jgi:DNA-directed RNA polymerase specialized sigma24 family protein
MIASVQPPAGARRTWQAAFLAMLPVIQRHVQIAFRHLPAEAKEEAIQESLANTCVAFARLFQQGRSQRAFPIALARFAVAQVRDGRTVGSSQNVREVLSRYAQRKKGFSVQRLDQYDREEQQWTEAVVEDTRTPVFDQVWFRIDFPAWLARLSPRNRRITKLLAAGYSTGEVATEFDISPSRVSQLRRQLHDSWVDFHGDLPSRCPGNCRPCTPPIRRPHRV